MFPDTVSAMILIPEAAPEAVTPPIHLVIEPTEAAVPSLGRAEVQEEAEAGDEDPREDRGPASGVRGHRGGAAGGVITRLEAITQQTVRVVIPPAMGYG